MRFPSRPPVVTAGLALILTLVLTACGGDSTGPGTDRVPDPVPGPAPAPAPAPAPSPTRSPDPITEADVAFVGNVVVPNVYGSLAGVIGAQVITPGTLEPPANGCPSFEPAPAPDTDADGVPDGTTFSFDAESCDTENPDRTIDWHGRIRVSDPGAVRGYDLEFFGFGVTIAEASGDFTVETRTTGPRSARGTTSTVTVTERLDFRNVVNLASTLRSRTEWELVFTAAVPGSITGDVLPAGSARLDGVYLVDDEVRQFELVVESLAPLVYDPTCTSFTSGELRVTAAGRADGGEVRVRFNACGVDPTFEFVPGQG